VALWAVGVQIPPPTLIYLRERRPVPRGWWLSGWNCLPVVCPPKPVLEGVEGWGDERCRLGRARNLGHGRGRVLLLAMAWASAREKPASAGASAGAGWLSLGADILKVAGSNLHNAELAEAQGLAAARWNGLVGMESQIQREEAALAIRPKNRPAQPRDDALPDRALKQRDAEWQDKTKYLRDSLAALRAEAASERRLLESYITKAR
jgi:hypothetical protein